MNKSNRVTSGPYNRSKSYGRCMVQLCAGAGVSVEEGGAGRSTGVSRKARADLEGFKIAPQQRTQLEKALIDRDSDLIKIDQDTRDSMSSDRARCGDTGIK